MSLKSSKVARLLDKSDSLQGCEECLEAYCFQKFIRGSSCGAIQRKLWLLSLYLRATDRSEMANQVGPLIQHLSLHVLSVEDGACDELGSKPLATAVGIEAWNRVRRSLPKKFRKLMITFLEEESDDISLDGDFNSTAGFTSSSPQRYDVDEGEIRTTQELERDEIDVQTENVLDSEDDINRLESRRHRRMQRIAEEREESQQHSSGMPTRTTGLSERLQSMPTNSNSPVRRTFNRLRSIGRTTSAPVHSTSPPTHSSRERANSDDSSQERQYIPVRREMRRNMSSATTHSQHGSVGPACTINQSVPLSEILMKRTVSAPIGEGFWTYSSQHRCLMMRPSGERSPEDTLTTLRLQNPRWDAPPPSTDSLPTYEPI